MPVSFAIPLKPCETATSYASRSARELGLSSPNELCTELGLYWPFVARGDLDHFECLAKVCGAKLDDLLHWSVRQVDRAKITLCGEILAKKSMSRTRLRVCPICILEDVDAGGITNAYRRNYWQPLWISSCQDHEVSLASLPHHEHSHKNYDFVGRISEHIDLIRERAKSAGKCKFSSFDRYVKNRLAGQHQVPYLDSFNLHIACRLCEKLGASLIAPDRTYRSIVGEDWHAICQEGFDVLQAGENALFEALAQLRRDAPDGQTKYRQNLGPLYEWLRCAHECEGVGRLKDSVSDFVFQSYPIKEGTKVLRRTCPETRNFHAASASAATGIYEHRMHKIFRQAEASSLERDAIERLVASTADYLNRKGAWQFLGLTRQLFNTLVRSGIVKKHQNPIDADKKYRRSDLITLIQQVKENTITEPLPNQKLSSLSNASHRAGRPFDDILSAILSGQLTRAVLSDSASSLASLQIDVDEVRRVLGRGVVYSREEVRGLLRIRTQSIPKLIEDGYLLEKPGFLSRTYANTLGICRQSVSDFQAKFITLGEIASEAEMHPPAVAKLLKRTLVPEIESSPGCPRFYLRADLSRHSADLQKVGITPVE